ncbi:MAG: helix-turn-helix domain-containing protein [Pseudomonadota bacterium]
MVGSRQFDETHMLDAAMRVFWRKGYAAATIDDLVSATQVKRGSLYLAYGNKEGLFRVSLEAYVARVNDPLLDTLEAGDLTASLRRIFETQARGGGADTPPGCLITQSAAELGARSDGLGEAIRDVLKTIEARIRARVDRAITGREISPAVNAGQLTQFVAGTMRILPVIRKARGSAAAQAMADASITALRAWIR